MRNSFRICSSVFLDLVPIAPDSLPVLGSPDIDLGQVFLQPRKPFTMTDQFFEPNQQPAASLGDPQHFAVMYAPRLPVLA
jgi:hypothetical protein